MKASWISNPGGLLLDGLRRILAGVSYAYTVVVWQRAGWPCHRIAPIGFLRRRVDPKQSELNSRGFAVLILIHFHNFRFCKEIRVSLESQRDWWLVHIWEKHCRCKSNEFHLQLSRRSASKRSAGLRHIWSAKKRDGPDMIFWQGFRGFPFIVLHWIPTLEGRNLDNPRET